MKKIISLLITLVLLLSFTACKKSNLDNEIATLDEFTEDEPLEKTETKNFEQEEISKDNTQTPAEQPSDTSQDDVPSEINTDTPVSSDEVSDKEDTDDMSDVEIKVATLSEYISYQTLEQFEEIRNMTQVVIFLGKRVDIECKQAIKYTTYGYPYEVYTDTTVEVITPYYGNVESGDIIAYRESDTAIESDIKTIIEGVSEPIGYKEYLFVLWQGDMSTQLLSVDYPIYYSISPAHDPRNIAERNTNYGGNIFNQMIYRKYVDNCDTALDEEIELKKALDWKKEYESRLANAGKSKMSKEEIEKMTLTDEETAKIKELVKRYNNMSKQ